MLSCSGMGQQYPFFLSHKLDNNPKVSKETAENVLYYYTKYLLAVEYEIDPAEDLFYKYRTEHYRVKLLTHASIEEFNKVYIPTEGVYDLLQLQARIIRKGKVIDVAPKLEEYKGDEEADRHYYFPISGLELGDEVEILYSLKMEPSFDGDQFHLQGEIPIYNLDFMFIAPNDSYFDFICHNGLKRPVKLDTILQRNHWLIHMDTVEAFDTEHFVEYNNAIMKVDVSLAGEGRPGDRNYSPFDKYMEYYNALYNRKYKKKDLKLVSTLAKEIGVLEGSMEDKVRKIEGFMKNEFVVEPVNYEREIEDLIASRKGNGFAALRLYLLLFEVCDIDYEYGFTSDRYDTYFSPEIESAYFLQNYFIYFPRINQYMAPLDYSSRLGFMDYKWVPNYGFFIHMDEDPERQSMGSVRLIPSTTANQNNDSLIIHITVNDEMDDVSVQIERHLKGYDAGEHQAYYHLYNFGRKESVHNELLNFMKDRSEFRMTEIKNMSESDAFTSPLIIKGDVTQLNTPLLEKAGSKTIFKLGSLFGEYLDVNELRKKERDFVFANPFTTSTTIIIDFPQDIKVTNSSDIPTSKDFSSHADITISSEFEVKGSRITYRKHEVYNKHRYPVAEKEQVLEAFGFYNELSRLALIVENK